MDLTDLKGIISLMQRSELTELEIEVQDLKLRLARPDPNSPSAVTQSLAYPQPSSAAEPAVTLSAGKQPEDDDPNVFKSPMVGTFYPKPAPEEPPYVDIGSQVKPGDVLCIIEAMKVMNEIKSDIVGTVTEIFPEDGKSVEYGQPLFRIT